MSTKPFWFAFNTDAWLSSKSVRMMSLAERGAYIGLLATAWGEDQPGTLPAAEDFIRRLSEMSIDEWKVSGPVILAMFPLSECGTYRYNPRLLEEAGKREELSEKKAEAGRRSAAKRAAASTDGQQTGNTNPTPVEINPTGVDQKGNQLQSQLQLQAKAGGGSATPPDLPALKAEKARQEMVAARTDPDDLQDVAHSPLVKPDAFAAILKATGYPNLDTERYRLQIAAKSEGVQRTASQWRSRIIEFVNNDYTAGKLLTYPVQTPNEIPGNWDTARQGAYTAPVGMGIPHPSSYLKPDYTPR